MGRALGAVLLAPALMVAAATAAHADGNVVWNHKDGGGCLTADYDHHYGWYDVSLKYCSFGAAKWHDINVGGNVFIEQMAEVPGTCLAGYTDHDAYVEACSSGANDYQRWREIDTGNGWKLQNVATGECLDSDNDKVYTHECNDGNKYQLWT
ncbi:ricin-type beta-trefoil lectin domain protein [Streptomyces sp. NPDC052101]|uniref:RICIN domain-containing protein n=1 Tax=Streptomyces sp. NPDC052101 TaxID=3155763 RepID=UPI0034314981